MNAKNRYLTAILTATIGLLFTGISYANMLLDKEHSIKANILV